MYLKGIKQKENFTKSKKKHNIIQENLDKSSDTLIGMQAAESLFKIVARSPASPYPLLQMDNTFFFFITFRKWGIAMKRLKEC